MSLHAYRVSKSVNAQALPFDALIMAAMRQADTRNAELLKVAFPRVWLELDARYNAPDGVLAGDHA